MYESDITKFIRSLHEKNPNLADEQRKARAMWWDKQIDWDERKRNQDSKVVQQPYVYFNKP